MAYQPRDVSRSGRFVPYTEWYDLDEKVTKEVSYKTTIEEEELLRHYFLTPLIKDLRNTEPPEIEKTEIIKEEFKVLDLDNTELGVVNSEEEGIELFLSRHPVFDREAVKTFIYAWKILY